MGLIVSDYEKYAKCLDQSAGVIKDKAYQGMNLCKFYNKFDNVKTM